MRRWQVVLVVTTVLAAPGIYTLGLAGPLPCNDYSGGCSGAQHAFLIAFETVLWPWLAAAVASVGVVVAALARLVTRRRRRAPPPRTAP